ncbi:MAG TPA: hypothetical protein VMT52_02740 [Planctomycetota bacterium]|nr:hypothetical protein [Planctomycetota bacterium]
MTKEKRADSKGRVTLGEGFANRTVLVERLEDGVVIRLARVIPESESWLYMNKAALASVRRGLAQAKAGKLSTSPPDLSAAKELADQLQGD